MLGLELWAGLAAVIILLTLFDTAVLTRRQHLISAREAVANLVVWLAVTYACSLAVYLAYERDWLHLHSQWSTLTGSVPVASRPDGYNAHLQFLAVYVVELALSLDNVAVLALLYAACKVPAMALPRAMFWGLLIAFCLRLPLILGGAAILNAFDPWWCGGLFAGMLLIAMLRTLFMPDSAGDLSKPAIVRWLSRQLPLQDTFDGHRLVSRSSGRWAFTPLAIVVVAAAWTDLTYTADSIPAAFAVTREPFIAFAASALAILSLRSLFFAFMGVVNRLRYLKPALALILAYLALKTFLSVHRPESLVPTEITLGGVLLLTVAAVAVSLRLSRASAASSPDTVRPAAIDDLADVAAGVRRNLRKIAIFIAGFAVILFGIAIGPLPGPGATIIIPIGIAILATEFTWAQRLMHWMKCLLDWFNGLGDAAAKRVAWWSAAPILVCYAALWACIYWIVGDAPALRTFILMTAFGLAFPLCLFLYRIVRTRFVKPRLTTPADTEPRPTEPRSRQALHGNTRGPV